MRPGKVKEVGLDIVAIPEIPATGNPDATAKL